MEELDLLESGTATYFRSCLRAILFRNDNSLGTPSKTSQVSQDQPPVSLKASIGYIFQTELI